MNFIINYHQLIPLSKPGEVMSSLFCSDVCTNLVKSGD